MIDVQATGAAGSSRSTDILTSLVSRLSDIWAVVIYVLFGLLIGLPLLTVLLQAVMPGLFDTKDPSYALNAGPLLRTFASPRVVSSVLHSVELAAGVGVLSTAVGGLFAVLVQRFALPLRGLILSAPWLVFLTPGYLKAMAWVLLMAPGGYLAQLGLMPDGASRAFFGLGGLIFVHTISLFPLSAFIIGGALAGLGTDLEDAARLSGASVWRVWAKINLPLLRPAIILSCIAIFAEVLSDFGLATTIARTASFGVLTYGIYAAASDYPVDFPMAGTQALILLCLILVVFAIERSIRRNADPRLISGRSRGVRLYEAGTGRWIATGIAVAIVGLALYLPMAAILVRAFTDTLGRGLALSNFTLANMAEATRLGAPASGALIRSLIYSLITAIFSTGLALILCGQLDRASATVKAAVLGVAVGSIAIPGIVLGFGYILVWNRLPGFRDWPFPHYGDASLLMTGYIATALPYCVVVILSAVGQLAPGLSDAARVHGAGAFTRLIRITLPLVLLAVVTAFLLTFIRTVFELPISQLLVPQSGSPAPPYVVRLLGHDSEGPAAALTLVSMVLAGSLAAAGWVIARRFLTFGDAPGKGAS